jgi:hypothetical protein
MLKRVRSDFGELRAAWAELNQAAEDIEPLREKLRKLEKSMRRFMAVRSDCEQHINWLNDDSGRGIGFEDLSTVLKRSPDALRDKYFRGIPRALVRLVMRGIDYRCPICGAKH